MNEFREIQSHIDKVTMTTAERRHEHQRCEAARRLKQIEARRKKAEMKKAFAATDPKLQQSRNFTDQVTDDNFLHIIDE